MAKQFWPLSRHGCRSAGVGRRGATAIEFALVSPVLFVLLFAIIETSLVYLQWVVLEGAVREATRLIRTGQVFDASSPVDVFQDELCRTFIQIVRCSDAVYYVTGADSFAGLTTVDLFNADGTPRTASFTNPGPNETVLVQVGYRWEFLTPFIGELLGGTDNAIVISSTAVFRNEPFPNSEV